jgi:hypothetical protein
MIYVKGKRKKNGLTEKILTGMEQAVEAHYGKELPKPEIVVF